MKASPHPSHTFYRPATRLSPGDRLPESTDDPGAAGKTRNGGGFGGGSHYHSIDILKGYVETPGSEILELARRMISTKQVPYSKALKSSAKRKAPK